MHRSEAATDERRLFRTKEPQSHVRLASRQVDEPRLRTDDEVETGVRAMQLDEVWHDDVVDDPIARRQSDSAREPLVRCKKLALRRKCFAFDTLGTAEERGPRLCERQPVRASVEQASAEASLQCDDSPTYRAGIHAKGATGGSVTTLASHGKEHPQILPVHGVHYCMLNTQFHAVPLALAAARIDS